MDLQSTLENNNYNCILDGISNEDYHKSEGLSKTDLCLLSRSKEHYEYVKQNQSKSKAMLLGSAVHDSILSPDYFNTNYVKGLEIAKRSGEEKAIWAKFNEDNKDKVILEKDQLELVQILKDRFFNHPRIAKMIEGAKFEQSIWSSKEGDIRKCRPDILRMDDTIIDIKTCDDASPIEFARDMVTRYYDLQAAWYLDITNQTLPNVYRNFIFIAMETKAPYGIAIYDLPEKWIENGRNLYKKKLEKIKQSQHKSYSEYVQALELPNYALNLEMR